jgi:hypothetical protein
MKNDPCIQGIGIESQSFLADEPVFIVIARNVITPAYQVYPFLVRVLINPLYIELNDSIISDVKNEAADKPVLESIFTERW